MPMLIKCVEISDGSVLEFGAGLFSTPLLHWLCFGRKLITYEDNLSYYKFAKKFTSRNHTIRFVKDWNKIDLGKHWGVVLIDHISERRSVDAIRLKDKADYIVLHDTQSNDYKYNEVWKHFKYRYDWKACKPWTSVVSNFKDISKWI